MRLLVFTISLYVALSSPFCLHIFSVISISSCVGMFVYILVLSKETNFKSFLNGTSCRTFIRCMEFLTLKMCGSGMNVSRFLASFFASLYAGASFQLMMGLMGASVLCILIKPLIVGGDGDILTYFHLSFFCKKCEHSFMILLSSLWNFLVSSLVVFVKLLWMKSEVFSWYESCEMMTVEFPLSALEIVFL
jgi:hypothetical protein